MILPEKIHSYAASQPGASLQPFDYDRPSPGPTEVLIRISHCGICHSDLHLIDNDWRNSPYPLVPGHEIVGEVVAMGAAVSHLKLGQRVGVGWQRSACMNCEWCTSGQENLCQSSQATCLGHHGGFADYHLTDSRFAFALPEQLSSVNAAPLLCGGVTVYSPLQHYGVRHWHRVAVVGIGGLGHMALQFARAIGCEVTALSRTDAKRDEALELGAHHFVATEDPDALKSLRGSFDFVLVTATADLDWKPYVRALRPNGRICFVSGANSEVKVPLSMLLGGQISISGSVIGGRAIMAEMLDFAARKGIQAMTEPMPFSQVNEALDHLRSGKARYRVVLEW